MMEIKACPNCGKPLADSLLQGLCPECLMKAGWPTEPLDDLNESRFVPPDIEELALLFPQLEILEQIAKGGMGAVYRARQPELDRLAALKILIPKDPKDPDFAERFGREARALARLSHPNIVAVYDFGHIDALHYFIMEYVDGPNLRDIEKAGEMTSKEALQIIPQICEALQFAHDEGIVHRDIKPENILLDRKGRVKIADFGLAKILGRETQDPRLTLPGHVMGTPHYMAPEQVEHPQDVDHRADIYSLGVVFYEMLTGELPMGKFKPPSQKVQVDVRLDEVVLKTLAKEPQLRYQQVSQVATEVETIQHSDTACRSQARKDIDPSEKEAIQARLRRPARWLQATGMMYLIPCLVVFWGFLRSGSALATVVGIQLIIIPVFIIVGSLQMQRLAVYRSGVISGALAILYPVCIWGADMLGVHMNTLPSAVIPGLLLGVVAAFKTLRVLLQPEVREAFEKGTKRPGIHSNWSKAIRYALWTTLVHAIPMLLIGLFIVFVLPRYLAALDAMGASLTARFRIAIHLMEFLQQYGVPTLMTVLIFDWIILLFLSAYHGRLACRWWSIAVTAFLVFAVGFLGFAVKDNFDRVLSKISRVSNAPVDVNFPFLAHFPQGNIELVVVSDGADDHSVGWKPDGSPAQEGPFLLQQPSQNKRANVFSDRKFVLRTTGLPDGASLPVFHMDPLIAYAATSVALSNGNIAPNLYGITATLPKGTSKADVKVGIATDEWITGNIDASVQMKSGVFKHHDHAWEIHINLKQTDQDYWIAYSYTLDPNYQMRVIPFTDLGTVITDPNALDPDTVFSDGPLTFYGEIRDTVPVLKFQFRPYHWVEFRNVSLVPGHRTSVQIKHAEDAARISMPPDRMSSASHDTPSG